MQRVRVHVRLIFRPAPSSEPWITNLERTEHRWLLCADEVGDVLVLDDFLLNPMTDVERRDLLEVIEDRYDRTSTVIATQMPTKTWHDALGVPTIADAICDRLVHNAHVLKLGGPSIRKKKALEPQPQPA